MRIIIVFIIGMIFMFIITGLPNLMIMYKQASNFVAIEGAWNDGWYEGFNSKLHENWNRQDPAWRGLSEKDY